MRLAIPALLFLVLSLDACATIGKPSPATVQRVTCEVGLALLPEVKSEALERLTQPEDLARYFCSLPDIAAIFESIGAVKSANRLPSKSTIEQAVALLRSKGELP